MSPLAPVFAVVLLGLGAAVHEACRAGDGPVVISPRTVFHAGLAGVMCLSILAVLLLEASAFHVGTLMILGAALTIALGLATRARRARTTDASRRLENSARALRQTQGERTNSITSESDPFVLSPSPSLRTGLSKHGSQRALIMRRPAGRAHLLLLLILLLGAWLRLPPSNWIVGGQDQGVYVNVANAIRRSGSVFIQDDLLGALQQDPAARDYYLRHSYLHTAFARASCDEGVYTPGVYVQDLAHGVLVPQFYHLYPLWLAISGSLFGAGQATLPLPAFALLSIGLIYRLTHELVGDSFAALAGALLLAVNPVHSYLSKFPVSEVPSAFFFLAGVYFLIRLLKRAGPDRFNGGMAVLAFGCVFLTRITGFLYLPILFAFLAYALIVVASPARRRALALSCLGIVIVYAFSALHGYLFACAYARSVYLAYLSTDLSMWRAGAILTGLSGFLAAGYALLSRYHRPLRRAAARLRPRRTQLAWLLIGGVLAWSTHAAYRFVTTPALYGSELQSIGIDPAASPELAGMNVVALATLNATVLVLLLTPVAIAAALYGTFLLLRRWPSQPQLVLCGALAVYFFGVTTIANVNARYLYFYARYLLSETIPLLLICAAVGLGRLHMRWPRTAVAALLLAAAPALGLSYLHTRDSEMKHVAGDLGGIAAALDEHSVVLVDRDILPDWRRLGAPLKLTFNLSPFWFDRADLEQGRLDPVLRTLAASHRPLFAITNDDHLATGYFAPERTLPLRLNVFLVKWMSLPVGYVTERDTTVTIYRSTQQLRDLAAPAEGNTAWDAR